MKITAAWIAEQKRLERTMLDAEQDMRELLLQKRLQQL